MAAKHWTAQTVEAELARANFSVREKRTIPYGMQFVLTDGAIINVYHTGKLNVQGANCDEKERATKVFGDATAPPTTVPVRPAAPAVAASNVPSKIFIVYGHDTASRDKLETILLRLQIKPIVLAHRPPDGKTIIEALIENSDVHYAVVLLTPDDEGHAARRPDEKKPRARQNVVLELGMFLAKLGREKVAILHKGALELPSDISGLIYIPFNNDVAEAKLKLASALKAAGFSIDIEALSAE
jgi:predicted nucleotide-binding protein